jgi:hypothetical protein
MTTVEIGEATRSEVERLKTAMHDHGLTAEQFQAATGRVVTAARERARRADAEPRSARRLPRGVGPTIRVLGTAWAALMLSTLTMALVSRSSVRRLPAVEPEANEIRIRIDLGPMAFTSRATAFRLAVIDCWYGGGFVDLREATLDPAGALLRVRAVFGGGQIVVPDGWRVVARVRGIGGVKDLRPAIERSVDAPVLTIEGTALFGGFSIESTISEKTQADLEKAVREMSGVQRQTEAVASV